MKEVFKKSKIYSYSFTCPSMEVQDMINISSGNTSDVESWVHMPVPRTLAGAESHGAWRTDQSHSYQSTATRWTTRTFGNPLDAQALPSQPPLPAGSHSDTSSGSHPGSQSCSYFHGIHRRRRTRTGHSLHCTRTS